MSFKVVYDICQPHFKSYYLSVLDNSTKYCEVGVPVLKPWSIIYAVHFACKTKSVLSSGQKEAVFYSRRLLNLAF